MHRDRVCEDCGDDVAKRRIRCPKCKLLVCIWCFHHVHKLAISIAEEEARQLRAKLEYHSVR